MAMTSQLKAGVKINQYRLETLLGRGASGEVWKASDGSRTVAIKFMNESLMRGQAAAKHRERMQREIDAMRSIDHPNIPDLFDYDLDAIPPYLVMRYINAPSFESLMRSGELFRLSLEQRLDLIEQLGQGLQELHNHGIIHRDLKPDNLVGKENPYVLDFSVSLPETEKQLTTMGVGTPLYSEMQYLPDKLGDIYSFALICYQILFRQHPIFPDRSELADCTPLKLCTMAQNRLKNDQWILPSQQTNIPAELAKTPLAPVDKVFARALGDRQQRYPTVMEFVEDLHDALGYPMQGSAVIEPIEPTPDPLKPQSQIPTQPDPTLDDKPIDPKTKGHGDRRDIAELAALIAVGIVLATLSVWRIAGLLGVM